MHMSHLIVRHFNVTVSCTERTSYSYNDEMLYIEMELISIEIILID